MNNLKSWISLTWEIICSKNTLWEDFDKSHWKLAFLFYLVGLFEIKQNPNWPVISKWVEIGSSRYHIRNFSRPWFLLQAHMVFSEHDAKFYALDSQVKQASPNRTFSYITFF